VLSLQFPTDSHDLQTPASVILAEDNPSVRTVQLEDGFAALADNMHMRRPVIVRIDYGSPPAKRRTVDMVIVT